jgi:hypothetical protein
VATDRRLRSWFECLHLVGGQDRVEAVGEARVRELVLGDVHR